MTTYIETNFKLSDDPMNIDKYRLAVNITVYHIISKLILQQIIITNFCCPESHLRKVQYRIWNPHQIKKNYALIKNAKIVMFKMDKRTFIYLL